MQQSKVKVLFSFNGVKKVAKVAVKTSIREIQDLGRTKFKNVLENLPATSMLRFQTFDNDYKEWIDMEPDDDDDLDLCEKMQIRIEVTDEQGTQGYGSAAGMESNQVDDHSNKSISPHYETLSHGRSSSSHNASEVSFLFL